MTTAFVLSGAGSDLAARGAQTSDALRALTTFDVRWACDVLRGVYDATGGVDGRVSIEVDPRLAHDTHATIAEARPTSRSRSRSGWPVRYTPPAPYATSPSRSTSSTRQVTRDSAS